LRHPFHFKVEPGAKVFTAWARVRVPTTDVTLPLKVEHVRESIRLKGIGNTATCSMAVCARREAECFPHPVEGYIDWFYKRAFVVSRLDKNGMPCECYVYAHKDGIGKLNDTKGGQQKLLAQLEIDDDRLIVLRVPPPSIGKDRIKRPTGRKDGKKRLQPRGAKLRFAAAQMGGVPA